MEAKKSNTINQELLARAKSLVEKIEAGDSNGIETEIDELARLRETDLYQEIGKLTRQLHDSISNFEVDSRISGFAENDIPDAKARLNHVIQMTENAAHKTMNALDEAMPISDALLKHSVEIHSAWEKFRSRELSLDDFREMSRQLDQFFPEVENSSKVLCDYMNNIMMAQDFQDLTGQIIRRVINLVQDVEDNLVELISLAGKRDIVVEDKVSEKEKDKIGHGPQVPGVDHGATVDSQDDVDELLSSLGF